jgi:hypothetical protein
LAHQSVADRGNEKLRHPPNHLFVECNFGISLAKSIVFPIKPFRGLIFKHFRLPPAASLVIAVVAFAAFKIDSISLDGIPQAIFLVDVPGPHISAQVAQALRMTQSRFGMLQSISN